MVSRVVVTGSINYDNVIRLPRMPEEHDKIQATNAFCGLGGSAANTATWLAIDPNLDVSLVGIVGDDNLGRDCIKSLANAGVDTSDVFAVPGWSTPRAWCLSDGPHKWIVTSRTDIDPVFDSVLSLSPSRIRHIHVSSRIDPRAVALLSDVADTSITISVETNGKALDEICRIADLVFMNSRELHDRYSLSITELRCTDVPLIAPKPHATLVVTDADRLVMAISSDTITTVQVPPIHDIVDRTGGGDAFDAGFLARWFDGNSLVDCLNGGLNIARLALTQMGGSRS